MSQLRLEQLFNRCDRKGTGFVDLDEFRNLCSGFGISAEDADMIFVDLDHDGDGRISFEDFSFGFRDFLTPGKALTSYIIAKFFQGGSRTKMEIGSENFSRASGAQKKGSQIFCLRRPFIVVEALKTAKNNR